MAFIRVAIVEDEADCREQTKNYIARYEKDNHVHVETQEYTDGLDFTEDFRGQFDIIFCDIQMKHMNGVKTAQYVRARDDKVILIFITNLTEYAIMGYEVMAVGYLLKPINYNLFASYMDRAVKLMNDKKPEYLVIKEKQGVSRYPLDEIRYCVCDGHYINVHMIHNTPRIHMSMKELEPLLPSDGFAKCSSGSIVNLDYVDSIDNDVVFVRGERIPLSRSQRKAFMEKLAEHLGGV